MIPRNVDDTEQLESGPTKVGVPALAGSDVRLKAGLQQEDRPKVGLQQDEKAADSSPFEGKLEQASGRLEQLLGFVNNFDKLKQPSKVKTSSR